MYNLKLSKKQIDAIFWWLKNEKFDAVIYDGAIRSGKTFCLGISFILWSFYYFKDRNFGICGKTILSLKRNLIQPLLRFVIELGFDFKELIRENLIIIKFGNHKNNFYLFGGKDESSFELIQGATFSGILFDEIVLMPESFVKQALARCSENKSKFFFNCNPDSCSHWFYKEWVLPSELKNTLYIHFKITDNPSLSPEILKRYNTLYTGAFFTRYILGKWESFQGLIYPFMSDISYCDVPNKKFVNYAVSCDYGIINPFSCGLWAFDGEIWFRIKEYYYDSKIHGIVRTDEEHYEAIKKLILGYNIDFLTIDPSAVSFIFLVKKKYKFKICVAKNNVIKGINLTSNVLKTGLIKICKTCLNSIKEFSLYKWQQNENKDAPLKENDHAMDDIRYFVMTVFDKSNIFFNMATKRNSFI